MRNYPDVPKRPVINRYFDMYRKDETDKQLIARADELLYQSKKNGRNRVTVG